MTRILRIYPVMFTLLALLCATTAQAASPFTIQQCNSDLNQSYENWEYTSMVVGCLKATIINATLGPEGMLIAISDFMTPLIALMIAVAIIIFGVRILGGEDQLKPKAIGFMLRIGLVWFFSYNLGQFGHLVFESIDELICFVSLPQFDNVMNNCYPWNFIDYFAGRLFGFGEHILIMHGVIGIIASALFNSTAGILVFLTGFAALLDVIFMILRIIFTYVSSLVVVAFMLIISPIVIPMALFYSQERYFKKWLDILTAAIFTPVLLFAFVGMFIGIYDVMIDRIIDILGGQDGEGKTHFDAYWRLNQPKFSWLMPADPNLAGDLEAFTNQDKVGTPAVQSFLNPLLRRAMDSNLFSGPGVDFGPATSTILQQLAWSFASLWLFSMLMKSMIAKIPEVMQSIAGAALGVGYQSSSFESGIKNAINSARDEAKSNPFKPPSTKNKKK